MPESFNEKTWADGAGGGTPLNAAALDDLEGRIETIDDRVNTLEGLGGGSATADVPYASVFLDDYAGANDDAKLTAALSAMAAETYPRAIQLRARNYSFATANRVAFEGLRIIGPRGYSNPERLSNTKMA